MKINFRQGIVSYPEVQGQGQAFLDVPGAGTVDIVGETVVAFAHRTADYLHVELGQEASGSYWASLPTSGNVWLYWDINPQTAQVTYGYTTTQPTSGTSQPGTLVGTANAETHWFDTNINVMKVYDGTRFLERIRVFAARLNGTALSPMGTNTASPYAGTQIGNNNSVFAGEILFSNGLPVIISTSGSFSPSATNPFARSYAFATTESEFVTGGTQKVNSIRLESDFVTAQAFGNIAAYDVVKWRSFGVVEPAGYNDTTSTAIGITVDAIQNGEIGTIILQGVIRNEQWEWPTVGQELFIFIGGDLTADDPNLTTPSQFPVSKPPVARVISEKEIVFMQGLGKVGPRGLNPESINSIGDVEITNVADGDVLTYTGSPLLWRNSAVSGTLAGLADTDFGSPAVPDANEFLQYDGNNWVNRSRRDASVGYFGVDPVFRAGSPALFQNSDAGRGVISTGSPVSTTNTWRVTTGAFELGDVITLSRRPSARPVNIEAGPNVQILSAFDSNTLTGGSPNSTITLGNPSQATLWLVELAGSPLPAGSPSSVYDVWMLNGTNVTFN